jgi:DUF1680 family protein
MLAYLSEDKAATLKADEYVLHILSAQDEDGYLGVFAPEIRFSRPGELWTQACLLRGLLDHAELTANEKVRQAVIRAVDLDIAQKRSGKRLLIGSVGGAGGSHDLMISDVAERLFDSTGDAKYQQFILALYGVNPIGPFDQPVLVLQESMTRQKDGAEVAVTLVPLGNAPALRRVTFPISP